MAEQGHHECSAAGDSKRAHHHVRVWTSTQGNHLSLVPETTTGLMRETKKRYWRTDSATSDDGNTADGGRAVTQAGGPPAASSPGRSTG